MGEKDWQNGLTPKEAAEFLINLKNNAYAFATEDVEKFHDRLCVGFQCLLMKLFSTEVLGELGEPVNTDADDDYVDKVERLRSKVADKAKSAKSGKSGKSAKSAKKDPSPKAPPPPPTENPTVRVKDSEESSDDSDDSDEEYRRMKSRLKAKFKENMRKIEEEEEAAAKAAKAAKREKKLAKWRKLVAQSSTAVAANPSSGVHDVDPEPAHHTNEADCPLSNSAPANAGVAGAESDKKRDLLGDEKSPKQETPKDGQKTCTNVLCYEGPNSVVKKRCGRSPDPKMKIPGNGTDGTVVMHVLMPEHAKYAGLVAGADRCEKCGKHQRHLINGARLQKCTPEEIQQFNATFSALMDECWESPDLSRERERALYKLREETNPIDFKKNFTKKDFDDSYVVWRKEVEAKHAKQAHAAELKKLEQLLEGSSPMAQKGSPMA